MSNTDTENDNGGRPAPILPPEEMALLMNPTFSSYDNNSSSESDDDDEGGSGSGGGLYQRQFYHAGVSERHGSMPIDVTEMQKVTHNDPSIRHIVGADQIPKLRGSTLMLANSMADLAYQKEIALSQRVVDTLQQELRMGDTATTNYGNSNNGVQQQQIQSKRSGRGLSMSQRMMQRAGNTSISKIYHQKRDSAALFLDRVHSNFFDDARSLSAGTIPQSIIVGFVVGVVCGIACFLYYRLLEFLLTLFWETIPHHFLENNNNDDEDDDPKQGQYYDWLWIPAVSLSMCICVGITVKYMGEPGDLPYTISRVHQHAYIPMDHVSPMVVASLFSIVAGGSLGPEAPLVAICGALGGWVSRRLFRQKYINVVRKHTLMGMAGALAAFFGCPLGGSLFALEVNSRFGVEYFEHMVEAIFGGEVCLIVYRTLTGLPIGPIWDLTVDPTKAHRLLESAPWHVAVGALIGLLGALVAYFFSLIHWANMELFAHLDLLDNRRAIQRALLGGSAMAMIGCLIPQTMFWGEEEFQIVANSQSNAELPEIWPKNGYSGGVFDMSHSPWNGLVVGIGKLFAISFTVAGGLRGGYIFPLMCTGAAFGTVLHHVFPTIPLQVCVLCMAAGINTAITRTSLATTIILGFLAGEPCAVPSILAAALCSLFATAYLPFIKSQITRSDIDHSLFHNKPTIQDDAVFDDDDDD